MYLNNRLFSRESLFCRRLRRVRGIALMGLGFVFFASFTQVDIVSDESEQPSQEPFVLVIDAGHGGKDVGAQGEYALEKDINLNIALDLMRRFRGDKDVKVIMTRHSDVYLTLDERAQIANKQHADLFVSIHTNSSEFNRLARGTETYFVGAAASSSANRVAEKENNFVRQFEDNPDEKYKNTFLLEAARMRNTDNSELMARLTQEEYIKSGARVNRGVQQAHFYVLMNTMMPAILTEVGFISTWDEESYLTSQKGVEEVAGSVYRAVLNYKNVMKEHAAADKLAALKHADNAHKTANVPMKLDESMGIYNEETHRLAQKRIPDEHDKRVKTVSEEPLDKESKLSESEGQDKLRNDDANGKNKLSAQKQPAKKPVEQMHQGKKVMKDDAKVCFYIQLMAAREKLEKTDKRLKGLWPMHYMKKGNFYKCLYYKQSDYGLVSKKLKKIKADFPEAYIVAYEGELEVPLSKARGK